MHLRRGLLRIYIAVSVPWIAFGYRFLDALQHPYQRRAPGAFWSLLLVPVGGPILLLVIMWVLAGFRRSEQTASEAKTSARIDGRPSVDARNAKSVPNNTEAGKALGKIFFEPDIWHEMSKFHEQELVTKELALARVAILRDAIRRLQPHSLAIQMSSGVDQYVAQAFAKQEHATTAMIAIQLYEQNTLPLTQMANVLVRRSRSGVTAIEIASLLEMATAEAEKLMSLSSALEKLFKDSKPR